MNNIFKTSEGYFVSFPLASDGYAPEIPVGYVVPFIVDSLHWLPCDGREVSLSEFPALNEVIGRFADRTVFKLPDHSGYSIKVRRGYA